jgi:hypothetical protein
LSNQFYAKTAPVVGFNSGILSARIMKPPFLKQNCKLVAFLGALFLMPGLSVAGNVIGSLPYTITASGNYELERDLTYAGPLSAITVDAPNVLINLNGFSITNIGNGAAFGVSVLKHTNLTVRSGRISQFQVGVLLGGSQSRAINLQLVNNDLGVQVLGKDCAVEECFIVGKGSERSFGIGINILKSSSAILVKGNQVSEFVTGILDSGDKSSSAFVGNYVANSLYGIALGPSDFYRGNVVTNCTVPFAGGNGIGTENGGD